jgi:asparagine synthetase B (glutamine-hydrolysing)
MCGFNILFNSRYLDIQATLGRMDQVLKHRGIRTKTVKYFRDSVAISHHRLPIVGLDPKWDHPYEAGSFDIGFVGELYNARDLYPAAGFGQVESSNTGPSDVKIGRAHV